LTQSTLWPTEEPAEASQPPAPTQTHSLTINEAEIACKPSKHVHVRRAEMAPGAYLFREGGRWHYHASDGKERPWIPKLVDRAADNWEIIPKEVAA
jgi:hypothetical protein